MCEWDEHEFHSRITDFYSSDNEYDDSNLIQDQDAEFELALKKAIEDTKTAAAAKAAAEAAELQQIKSEELKIATVRNEIRERANQIPSEPDNGIAIAFCFQDSTRIIRKFNPNQTADDIFAFIANDDRMFDTQFKPLPFDLTLGLGQLSINRMCTLAQQGLTHRTLVRIVVDED
jgi:hypothetical protein